MNRWFGLGLLLIIAGALALRCPQLDRRPMHNDEAVNADKISHLWQDGLYKYNPDEYHGPTLHYAALPFVWLSHARTYAELDERTLRLVPVFFGVLLIGLLWLMADGLTRSAAFFAGILTALSPAMVFYSRYFIHEMLLVCFTMLALGAGWRYWQTRQMRWALLAGVGLGLMHATKETFVISVAAMVGGVLLTWFWNERTQTDRLPEKFYWKYKHAAAALGSGAFVSVVLFSSFFSNPVGLWDSVITYLPWLERAGGHSPHMHPTEFYLQRLAYFHLPKGQHWSEGLILGLAFVGAIASIFGKGLGGTNVSLARFLTFYTALLTLAYSAISYKTPWCMLGFLHGMILLAGIGIMVLFRLMEDWPGQIGFALILGAALAYFGWFGIMVWLGLIILTALLGLISSIELVRVWSPKIILAVLLLGGLAHLGWQAWKASFPYASDWRNPYVYAQTLPNTLGMVTRVQEIAKVLPAEQAQIMKVITPGNDCWPLPYYFRNFSRAQVGYYDNASEIDNPFPIMIVGARFQAALDEKTDKAWLSVGYYEFRPKVWLELFVKYDVWKKYLENRPKPKEEEEE